jgi:enoyl-CoA hydratase/carnithine racemase
VVADADLAALAQATAQRITTLAPQAACLNKQTLRALNQPLALIDQGQVATDIKASDDPLTQLLTSAYAYADRAEQREGISAFLEKRPPVF